MLASSRSRMRNLRTFPVGPITISSLVEHYERIELAEPGDEESGRAYSTRTRLKWLLHRWVVPRWGKLNINDVKTVADVHRADTCSFLTTYAL